MCENVTKHMRKVHESVYRNVHKHLKKIKNKVNYKWYLFNEISCINHGIVHLGDRHGRIVARKWIIVDLLLD